MKKDYQLLLSLPPAAVTHLAELEARLPGDAFAINDPAGSKLGSGGGLAHVLVSAWRASGVDASLAEWLGVRQRLVLHSGGQSRRCPAYAAEGKVLTPMPVLRWSYGQRLDQTLLDLQRPFIEDVLRSAPEHAVAGVYSGDVLLHGRVPAELPDADVICVGLWTSPEAATHHGVFFCDRGRPDRLRFMRQKPSVSEIRDLGREAVFLIDSGFWLFSERAVQVLFEACGWEGQRFANDVPAFYDLYTTFGMALGERPSEPRAGVSDLSVAVVPVKDGVFYHLGTSRELVTATLALQNAKLDQHRFGSLIPKHPAAFIQNADVGVGLLPEHHTIWIENAWVPTQWRLCDGHVLTGIPDNDWQLTVPAGVCLDMVPVDDGRWCIRPYGIDDAFRGAVGEAATQWFGNPLTEWFDARGLTLEACGIEPDTDMQDAALFAVVAAEELCGEFVQWLLGGESRESRESGVRGGRAAMDWAAFYRDCPRLSAADLGRCANVSRRALQRRSRRARSWQRLAAHPERSIFLRTDLDEASREFAEHGLELPPVSADQTGLSAVRLHMLRAAVQRRCHESGWQTEEDAAFASLREMLLHAGASEPVSPVRHLLSDQIIWGRSPVRLDLAGGWTDTPPYCMVHGGRVVTMAVELNGQPPIQVFGRCTDEPVIMLRSIDLGQHEKVTTYAELGDFAHVGGSFSIPKAALALAGFLPAFNPTAPATLRDLLQQFGGGIELTLLAAVPKGSGLGTSSILAATVLGTVGDLCGLEWRTDDLIMRTLVLEQLLTTGGGWQDQAGGVTAGVTLLESEPGERQDIRVRWLPDTALRRGLNSTVMLYYTGLTRIAKGILQEVVRKMFLNSGPQWETLRHIGDNAERVADALMGQDYQAVCACVRRSWELNCLLDRGTNPPRVQDLLRRIEPWLAGSKLLGAGGGGYMLMLAKDEDDAARIRRELTDAPPNPEARFVDLSISDAGLQITRS